jgi:hypothetical protein
MIEFEGCTWIASIRFATDHRVDSDAVYFIMAQSSAFIMSAQVHQHAFTPINTIEPIKIIVAFREPE